MPSALGVVVPLRPTRVAQPALPGDLYALADAVAAAAGGAVLVEDHEQRVLAHSTRPGHPLDALRSRQILERRLPDFDGRDAAYRRLWRAQGAVRFPGRDGLLPRVAVAVRCGAELLGAIWVIDGGEPHHRVDALLAEAAETTALHLLRTRTSTAMQADRESLRLVLEGRGAAAGDLELAAETPCRMVGFAPADSPDKLSRASLLELVALTARTLVTGSIATVSGGTVWALLPDADERAAGRLVDAVAARVPVAAAVSDSAEPLSSAPQVRADLDDTLAVLRSSGRRVASPRDVRPQIALRALAATTQRQARHRLPSLTALLAHDRAHGGDYAATVLAYLDCLGDVVPAAARLAVHPNTFRHRLRRAAELFDLDLDNADERLVLWLQLRATKEQP